MTWSDIPRHPTPRTLRQFALLWLLVFGALGSRHLLLTDRPRLGLALIALAVGVGVPGLIRPRLLRPIFVAWMIAVFPIGWLVSRVFLAALYYGVLTPLGLWFRLRGRDALRRRRPESVSHWRDKPAAAGAASYYRQF
jgi:hypothetical protein